MNIIRDAATLLILALLVISVRVTPLDPVGDLVPPVEAADVNKASMLPAVRAQETPEQSADADCPVRTRTLRCTIAEDGSSRCELELQQVKTLVLPAAGPEAPRVVSHTCT